MNKQDAESLLANTFSDEFTQALLDAIEDGISCYINRGNGLAFLTDWMRTTIYRRRSYSVRVSGCDIPDGSCQ